MMWRLLHNFVILRRLLLSRLSLAIRAGLVSSLDGDRAVRVEVAGDRQ